MARRSRVTLTAALAAVALCAGSYATRAGAAATHSDPAANVTLPASLVNAERTGCAVNRIDNSATCTRSLLAEINYGLATEGLAPITLPSDWASLSVPEQLFVIVDLERVDRGLEPFVGLSFVFSIDAQVGAFDDGDPPMPGGYPWVGTEWAGGSADVSALESDYGWMYDDGFGGPNIDCTTAGASGCWAHRDNILAAGSCTTCVVGAGYAVVGGSPSMAALFVEPSGATPPLTFTWAGNVAPYLGRGFAPAASTGTASSSVRATTGTGGYREVAADGGVFALGSSYDGSMGGTPLHAPIVGVAEDPWTGGYWEVASDGGIFAFDAPYFGSMGGHHLNAPIVGMATDPLTGGYWEVASDGGVFAFHAPFYGSMGGTRLRAPIVGIARGSRRRRLPGGGARRRHLLLPRPLFRLHGGPAPERTHRGHGPRPVDRGLLGSGLRRRDLQLRRSVLRVHGGDASDPARRRHRRGPRRGWVLGGGVGRRCLQLPCPVLRVHGRVGPARPHRGHGPLTTTTGPTARGQSPATNSDMACNCSM